MVALLYAMTVATTEQQAILVEYMGFDSGETIDVPEFAVVSQQSLSHQPLLAADPI